MNSKEILKLKFYSTDLGEEVTIGHYLNILLLTLWEKGECFSGKRPLGNGGWKYDIYTGLVKHGIVDGRLDEEGYVEEVDDEEADKITTECIRDMGVDYE